jgi:hypothetical protein
LAVYKPEDPVLAREVEFTNIWETLIYPDLKKASVSSSYSPAIADQTNKTTLYYGEQPRRVPAFPAADHIKNSSFPALNFADMEQLLELPVGMRSPDSGIDDLADLDRETPILGDVMMTDMPNLPLYTDAMLTTSMPTQDIELDFDMLRNEDLFDLSSMDNKSTVIPTSSATIISRSDYNIKSPVSNQVDESTSTNVYTTNNIKKEEDVCIELNVPVTEVSPRSPSRQSTRSPSPSGSDISDWSVDERPALVRRNRKKLTAEQVLRKSKNSSSPVKRRKQRSSDNKKLKLYEVDRPLNNPEAEKCRLNAINAKKNRERKKAQLNKAETEISRLRSENAELREQAMTVREELDHALHEIQELKSLMKLAGLPVEDREE